MKNLITYVIVLLGTDFSFSQVGIGTENPEAMLDVAGTLLVQDTATMRAPLKLEYIESETVSEFTGNEIVLIADLADQKIVKRVALQTLSNGMKAYNLNQPNPTVYSAKVTSNITLLSLGLFNNWQPIQFPPSSKVVGASGVVDANGVYTVPSDGVYSIGIYFRYGTGLQASLLGATPRIGIIKRPNGTTGSSDVELDGRNFTGINLASLVNLTISEAEINSLYPLRQGDKIYFSLNRGGITLGLLSTSASSFYICKVAGLPSP